MGPCFQLKTKVSQYWRVIQMGTLLLLLLFGCTLQRPQDLRVEIISSGFKDFYLTCPHPNAPIRIISNYTGSDEAYPSVLTNGSVVFFVTGKVFDGIGWDNEDLSRGGQALDENLTVTGSSVVGEKWWIKIVDQDCRFTISDALDYQNSKEESDVSTDEDEFFYNK